MRVLRSEEEIMQNWKGDTSKPLVSICCITYNHQPYIEDSLEGFLIQETDFPFEIVIHDDASKDKTAEIIRECEVKYPKLIKPIYQTENQYSQGKNPFIPPFELAQGKYIALCEGDDYWLDPYKLQNQISFLENNVRYSGSAHQARVIYAKNKKSHPYRLHVKHELKIGDLLGGRLFHTASFIFRRSILQKSNLPHDICSVDRALPLLCASVGPVNYLDDCMCVYRKSDVGISSWATSEIIAKDLNMIPWLKKVVPGFPSIRYSSLIHATIISNAVSCSFKRIIFHYLKFVILSFSYFPSNLVDIAKFTIKSIPKIIYRRIKWNHRSRK